MKTIIDQTGNEIRVADEIESLVSLVPSLTELLFFFKMDEKIKGVTDFCVHPVDKVALKTKVGGPLNFNIDKIESLRPDIVFASKGENVKDWSIN
jgi:ABC-type Fe3+-hydroxamate transport system substrate-binding protein